MSQTVTLEPRSFSDIFVAHEFRPHNAVSRQLKDTRLQENVLKCLARLGQTRFIDLTAQYGIAEISIALYAGDGVVTKITPQRFMAKGNFPFVVPPFHSEEIESGIVIANYPYVSTKGINEQDVEYMRTMLAEFGLRFRRGDDRPDNVGRLPDGTLAVIDGNALEVTSRGIDREKVQQASEEWTQKIQDMYPELYAPDFHHRQSKDTDFTLRSIGKYEEEPVAQSSKRPEKSHRSWLSKRLNGKAADDSDHSITR